MDIIEELKFLIETEQEKSLVEFLKKLNEKERSALSSIVKQLLLHYRTLKNNTNFFQLQPTYIGSEKQIMMTYIASFFCLDRKNFELMQIYFHLNGLMKKIKQYHILQSYCPQWFDGYIQDHPFLIQDYKQLTEYSDKGYLTLSKELIVHSLRGGISMEIDEIPDITLNTHIWYLFENDFWFSEDELEQWFKLFEKLILAGKLDSYKVAKSALETLPRENLNVKFIFGLIEYLKLNETTVLSLQEELLAACETTHTKAIVISIKYLRNICTHSHFKIDLFLDKSTLLLSSQSKSILTPTISIIDKLMKSYPHRVKELGSILIQALAFRDSALQVRVLKILNKHNILDSDALLSEITLYDTFLFLEAKEMLPSITKEENLKSEVIVKKVLISDENRVPSYESFEEIIFFFAQVFEGNTLNDFDIALALLPKLHNMITQENVEQLRIIFSYTEKRYRMGNPKGIIDFLLLHLIARYALDIQKSYPSEKMFIQGIFDRNRDLLSTFYTHQIGTFYSPYQELIDWTYSRLCTKDALPMLSTPTHTPCLIAFDVLVEKLVHYQANELEPNINDFQLALSRVYIQEENPITQKLNGEYRDILLYLCGDIDFNIDLVTSPHLWLIALLRRDDKRDKELFIQHYEDTDKILYPYTLPQWNIETCEHNNTHIILNNREKNSKQENILSKITRFEKKKGILFEDEYYDLYPHDGAKFLSLSPHNLEYVIFFILKVYLLPRSFSNANPMRQAINILPIVYALWGEDNVGALSYLYLALALMEKDKNVRLVAMELWITTVSQETMNHQLLGDTLGKLEHNEYAPLKRFTDLIIDSMLGISTLHNQALFSLLNAMLSQMNEEPIKGMKKLLEIYREVLSITNEKVPEDVLVKLEAWAKVKSLNPLITKLQKV